MLSRHNDYHVVGVDKSTVGRGFRPGLNPHRLLKTVNKKILQEWKVTVCRAVIVFSSQFFLECSLLSACWCVIAVGGRSLSNSYCHDFWKISIMLKLLTELVTTSFLFPAFVLHVSFSWKLHAVYHLELLYVCLSHDSGKPCSHFTLLLELLRLPVTS